MKYCQNCGTALDDNARFCIECGAVSQERTEYSAPVDYSTVPLISNNTVLNTVRECASSRLFLIAIIFYTATTVLSFINAIYTAVMSANMVADIGGSMDEIYEVAGSATIASGIFSAIISAAPSVLIAVGMWITYSSAKGDGERIKTSGLTIIKVVQIIMLVLACVVLGIGIPLFILVIVLFRVLPFEELMEPEIWQEFEAEFGTEFGMSAGEFFNDMLVIAWIVLLVVLVVAGVLAILYTAKTIKTINSIKETAEAGVVKGKVSSFVAVMSMIIGGFMALVGLSVFTQGSASYLSGFVMLVNATSSILFGALIFNFKSKIKAINEQI